MFKRLILALFCLQGMSNAAEQQHSEMRYRNPDNENLERVEVRTFPGTKPQYTFVSREEAKGYKNFNYYENITSKTCLATTALLASCSFVVILSKHNGSFEGIINTAAKSIAVTCFIGWGLGLCYIIAYNCLYQANINKNKIYRRASSSSDDYLWSSSDDDSC